MSDSHRMKLKERIANFLTNAIVKYPFVVFFIFAVVLGFFGWRASLLTVNPNQIDLLPQNLNSVKASKKMIKMNGGVGYLLIALRSKNPDSMKLVANRLKPQIEKIPDVISVSIKRDMNFVRKHILYLIKTEDLEDGYSRVRKKIRQVIAEKNPFSFHFTKKKEKVTFDDLIKKYQFINKKGVEDDYNIDPAKEMLIMIVKPKGNAQNLDATRRLLSGIDKIISNYNKYNKDKMVLKNGYKGVVQGSTVTYGFTGDYKNQLDNSELIINALKPTSVFAFVGILIYLIILLRRFSLVSMIMGTLVSSIIMTFGVAHLTFGELNIVTVILSAILMGFGIDFGIHFIFRIKEEYTRSRDFTKSLYETLLHSGGASVISSITIALALFSLLFSEFRGFSQFGLIAGIGVFITALNMYILIPTVFVIVKKIMPNLEKVLIQKSKLTSEEKQKQYNDDLTKKFPYAKPIFYTSVAVTIFLTFFAFKIKFNYDSRALMSPDSPSFVLQNEINDRFNISSDPAAIYTETLAETKELYEKLSNLPKDTMVESVMSIFTICPPMDVQKANYAIMQKVKKKLEMISPDMLDPKTRKYYLNTAEFLNAKPFALKDVPKHLEQLFRPVPGVPFKGYLTFLYPKIGFWNSKNLMKFQDEVGVVQLKNKKVYGAGIAFVFSDMAKIVLRDAKRFILVAFFSILLLLFIIFRKWTSVVYTILPLVFGITWMLGLMELTGWEINFMNIVVFPVAFGYGISTSVHLYHRFLETNSVVVAYKRTGAAVIGSSITTLIGWVALSTAHHNGITSMGILASFGIIADVVVSFSIMPAMIQIVQDRKEKKLKKSGEA